MTSNITIRALNGFPEVREGDNIAELIDSSIASSGLQLEDGDVLVVASKIVSKAEGRKCQLADYRPSKMAAELSEQTGKDARLVQAILDECTEVVRAEHVLIVKTHHGLVCANAGIDSSNVGTDDEVLLLPENPDNSAGDIRRNLRQRTGARIAVVISDSFGRPWRVGQVEVAIGCAGIEAVDDLRGNNDYTGHELSATVIAVADQVAAAADLSRAKDSQEPVILVRGLSRHTTEDDGPGSSVLIRAKSEDLFS